MLASVQVRGKAILFGEHAVVYGVPALAMPVDRRLSLRIRPDDAGPLLHAPGWNVTVDLKDRDAETESLRRVLQLALDLTPVVSRAIRIDIDSQIPTSAGLGSSAALAVALVRGLAQQAGESLTLAQQIDRALQLEKIFHAKPSGVDHHTVAHDHLLRFHADAPPDLGLVVAGDWTFVVAVVGKHGGTARRVRALASRRERLPGHYQALFAQIGAIVDEACAALAAGDRAALGALMDLNHGLLNALGVSSPALEQAVHAAREAGALGAKLSGAGGGGAMLALCEGDPGSVLQALQTLGYEAFVSTLAGQPLS